MSSKLFDSMSQCSNFILTVSSERQVQQKLLIYRNAVYFNSNVSVRSGNKFVKFNEEHVDWKEGSIHSHISATGVA
jgi:hypothetical protein